MAGDLRSAAEAAAQAWPLMVDNDTGGHLFDRLALIAARSGSCWQAGQLLGAADARCLRDGDTRQPNECRLAALAAAEIEPVLGADDLARLRAEGARFPVAQAFDIAHQFVEGLKAQQTRT